MNILKFLLKSVRWLLMACGVIFLVLAGRMFAARPSPPGPEASPFQTAAVTRGDVEITVSSTGSLAAVGTVEVGTQVSGTIDKVLADYNDKVSKGQILAVLDTSLFEASVTQAEADMAQCKAKLKQAQAEYNRNLPLYEKGHLSAQEFLSYETEWETARASVLASQADLDRAKANLDYTRIRSPIDGAVIERSIEEGQTVAASYSTPTLFCIAEDLSRMQIEADVDESDIGQIKTGQEARFTVQAHPEETFTGVVSQIRLNPEVVSNVVTYTVVVDAANKKGLLLPGMTATLDFLVNSAKDVLIIPNAALSFASSMDSGKPNAGAFVLVSGDDGRPAPVPVKTGVTDGVQTQLIETNLKEGELVVTGVKKSEKESKSNILSKLLPKPPGQSRGAGPGPGPGM